MENHLMAAVHIDIGRMDIHLPARLKSRAPNISRELDRALKQVIRDLPHQLGQMPPGNTLVIPGLTLPGFTVRAGDSDKKIAKGIAMALGRAVHHQITRPGGNATEENR
ncbi:MAG: hypothetical protein HUN04_16570 [Desulfobacter sp.]|nr:MAG: hypothetical protein HUN04_16570 [Desulfobacter sp.]